MQTAHAPSDQLGGDAGTILRQLRIVEHGHRLAGGWRGRLRAVETRIVRRWARRVLTPR